MTLRERLRAALEEGGRRTPDLFPGEWLKETPLTPAAVLVAITDRPAPGVLLTQRTAHLRSHPGQVALPGGRIDPEDDGPIAAALREAEEEIGLPRDVPDVLGIVDTYNTGSGYAVTPVLAVIPPDLPLAPHEAEVAEVFEVPLDFLLDIANHAEHEFEAQGRRRRYFQINYGERRIWGITAALIINLGRRLALPA